MRRIDDLHHLYAILDKLDNNLGGKQVLANCDGKMSWPKQGLYFFFEEGELRESGDNLRVVRVGTHAVSTGSKTTLWTRLRAHRGSMGGKYMGGGNHRGSIFRLHIGTALINQQNVKLDSWSKGSSAIGHIRNNEQSIEMKVSEKIRSMPFLWIKAEDESGPNSIRKYIEKNSIALLSNYQKFPIDGPSENWLGHYCSNEFVRHSSLWNVDHVDEHYDPAFLHTLSQLVDKM